MVGILFNCLFLRKNKTKQKKTKKTSRQGLSNFQLLVDVLLEVKFYSVILPLLWSLLLNICMMFTHFI